MKRIISLVALVLLCGSVFAITWEPSPQLIGNAAVSFAGETAIKAVGDTIYIAYLSRIDDDHSCLNFTKSHSGSSYTTQVMDPLEFPISSAPGAPSLVLDLPKITILVKGEDFLYQSFSADYGMNWTCQRLDEGLIESNDPYPLMAAVATGIRNFTVRSQANDPCMHFVNDYRSMNNTNTYFPGYDVIEGPVLVNSDLRIKQAGGGNNNGWPTFLGLVTIAGNVISSPSNYPLTQVFQGGLIENATPELFRPNHELFKNDFLSDAQVIGQDNEDCIYLLEVDGRSYTGWRGIITVGRRVYADVYDPYPSVGGTPLFRNNFTVVDTLWTPIAGIIPEKLFVKGTLWLKGSFSGEASIYCDSDIYLIGDILLSGTTPPSSPDLSTNPNLSDKVSLISEKQIIIKYGYKNPADSVRIHPNLGADNEYPAPFGGGISIYADLIALNKDPDNPRRDGMFTFEYQHPHPSVPAVNLTFDTESYYFDWIDLHRRHYPQTAANPWPPNIDYPWYNPLWPEKAPYLERGTVNLWGSLYQERQGYLHRTRNDAEYPSGSGIWDIDLDMCGGHVSTNQVNDPVIPGLISGARNYPGAAGSGVGYKKYYAHDHRSFDNMPRNDVWGLGALISESVGFDHPSSVVKWHKLNEPVTHKSMDQIDGEYLYHLNNTLFTDEAAYPQDLPEDWEIVQAKLLADGNVITLQKNNQNQSCRLLISDLQQSSPSVIHASPYTQDYISLHRIWDGFLFVIPADADNAATLIRLDENGGIVSTTDTLPLPADFGSEPLYDSRIALTTPEPGLLHACLWAKDTSEGSAFWHLQGNIDPLSADDPAIVPSALSLSCYPNPFTDTVLMEVKSPRSQPVKINIYNVKGQKVKSLQLGTQNGAGQISWNGNDEKGQPVAQGIYFARIADAQHSKTTKLLKIK